MSKLAKALTAAAGNAGGDPLYAEDVFSTYLYVGGNGSGTNQAVNVVNDVNLNEEGGLIWIKRRDVGNEHALIDTERGNAQWLNSNSTAAATSVTSIDSFNTDGFTVSSTGYADTNNPDADYASWTFRKAEKFFDVVTYTGDGNATHEIAHNLGSVPGCIIIKNTSNATNWLVYHKDTANDLMLNTTDQGLFQIINSVTSTSFNFSYSSLVNASGDTYVAYLFASDAGGFGDDGSESIIKCGEFSVDGSYEAEVECGFEPQWVLIKPAEDSASWSIYDTMRGAPVGGDAYWLAPNLSQQEAFTANRFNPTATGFHIGNYGIPAGNKIIYIAIRRPMKTPESGTEVFSVSDSMSGAVQPAFDAPHVVDMAFQRRPAFTQTTHIASRLTGTNNLYTDTTAAEVSQVENVWDFMDGWGGWSVTNTDYRAWNFKRATGFFDVVAYSGTSTIRQQAHNLGVAPEFVIVTGRNFASHWFTYHIGQTGGADALHSTMRLNSTEASFDTQLWKNYDFNESTFSLDSDNGVNGSSNTYIAYLFATLDGVSKVGSYTGTGNSLDIDCGFANGARFVMIKRTDSSSDWWIWDTARGIVAGNDPTLRLNSTAAETTTADYIDPLSSGFTLTTAGNWLYGMNYPTGNYIFLAIA